MFYLPVEDAASCFIPPCAETYSFIWMSWIWIYVLCLRTKSFPPCYCLLQCFCALGGEVGKKKTLIHPPHPVLLFVFCAELCESGVKEGESERERELEMTGNRGETPNTTGSHLLSFCPFLLTFFWRQHILFRGDFSFIQRRNHTLQHTLYSVYSVTQSYSFQWKGELRVIHLYSRKTVCCLLWRIRTCICVLVCCSQKYQG